MREPYSFHLQKNISVMQRSIQEDADYFTRALIHVLELIAEVIVCLVLGIYLFRVSRSITVIVLSIVLFCIAAFYLVSRKYSTRLGQKNQHYKGMLFQWMNQSLGGIKEIKILQREKFFADSFETRDVLF
jgi:ABC-type multidrug transport system fused ATPase/permease subunit